MPNPQPLPPGTVVVHVPGDVLMDAKKMQKITASTLGKLGCPGCHSGKDIRFVELSQFVVNPKTFDVDHLAIPQL